MSYDRALTVFSPDGHLFQVEYAQEAVKKAQCAVGVKGKDCVVLAMEKKSVQKLQDSRTLRKMYKLDEHVYAACGGLSADARVLMNKAQLECQRFRLNYEDAMDVDLVARHVAEIQQKSTQSGGSRPYGVATIVGGFNEDGTAHLWQTEPSGMCMSWKACVIGRNSKTVLDAMEKSYQEAMDDDAAIKFGIKALLEVVESGSSNTEVLVLKRQRKSYFLDEEKLTKLVTVLEKERDEEQKKARAAEEE